jgi:cellulose synthase/poly-beta-1,6-N-acetylglucosamine synthase-like glycosyltransferase
MLGIITLACIVAFLTKAALSAFARLDADSSMKVDLSAREQMTADPIKTLSVVIPAYNEEQRLPATLQEMIWSVGDTTRGPFIQVDEYSHFEFYVGANVATCSGDVTGKGLNLLLKSSWWMMAAQMAPHA